MSQGSGCARQRDLLKVKTLGNDAYRYPCLLRVWTIPFFQLNNGLIEI